MVSHQQHQCICPSGFGGEDCKYRKNFLNRSLVIILFLNIIFKVEFFLNSLRHFFTSLSSFWTDEESPPQAAPPHVTTVPSNRKAVKQTNVVPSGQTSFPKFSSDLPSSQRKKHLRKTKKQS